MLAETLKKFAYPQSLVKEYGHWLLLCRYQQPTLGSLILICKEEKTSFSEISQESFAEFGDIIKEVEPKLKSLFGLDKINYLMLMMHDPEVHFHIIPRYARDVKFDGVVFRDTGWPNAASLRDITEIGPETFDRLVKKLKFILA